MCKGDLQDFWMKQVLTKEQMQSSEAITELKGQICNAELNSSSLTELSTSLVKKELEFREDLLEQSREETNAALPPSGEVQEASSVGKKVCCAIS